MSDERFERMTIRRTARFTVYGVYDKDARTIVPELSTRERERADCAVINLNRGATIAEAASAAGMRVIERGD